MTVAVVSIVLLVALFAATVIRGFDLGLAALSAAFFLGLAAGVPVEEITGFFPADFFVLIVGVTALFAAAQLTGTLDWILDLLLRLVGGRIALVALVPFVIGAVLTAIGTLPAAATAIVAPIALGLAARYRIMPLVAAILGITGIIAGLLSPLAVYGITARELSQKLGIDLPGTAAPLFLLGGIVAGLAVSGVCLLIGLRTGAVPRGRITDDDDVPLGGPNPTERRSGVTTTAPATTTARVLTVGSLVAVVVLSVGFDLNVGYLGLTAALFLQVTLRITPGEIIGKVPWNVVVLIGGLLTYVGLMQHLGAFERISELLRVQGSASLSLLVLCYIAGV